jgi:hypothetical protein
MAPDDRIGRGGRGDPRKVMLVIMTTNEERCLHVT